MMSLEDEKRRNAGDNQAFTQQKQQSRVKAIRSWLSMMDACKRRIVHDAHFAPCPFVARISRNRHSTGKSWWTTPKYCWVCSEVFASEVCGSPHRSFPLCEAASRGNQAHRDVV